MNFEKIDFLNKLYHKIIGFIDSILIKQSLSPLIILKRFLIQFKADVIYLIEDANWAIKSVGKYITYNLKKSGLIIAEYDRRYFSKNKIIHYGSINCILRENAIFKVHESNSNILTFFHVSSDDYYIKYIPYLNKKIDLIHTSNNITKEKLIELGFEADKIVVIPLGIDLSIFRRFNQQKKIKLKDKLKIPQEKIIIGSFQKDGVGWDEGLEPKLVKGPDIFCEVVRKLNEVFDVHIFLTGPARGYVKRKLEGYKIPFTHIIVDKYKDMVNCYNILDLYLITSRIEGGPLALLECMATGVPVVSTKVGMAPEIIKSDINGFLAEIDNVNQLFQFSCELIRNKELREKLIYNGFSTVKNYSWEKISKQYHRKLYKKFLLKRD
jgi:glycosyltransferase involved in cell wall biosynthesis